MSSYVALFASTTKPYCPPPLNLLLKLPLKEYTGKIWTIPIIVFFIFNSLRPFSKLDNIIKMKKNLYKHFFMLKPTRNIYSTYCFLRIPTTSLMYL